MGHYRVFNSGPFSLFLSLSKLDSSRSREIKTLARTDDLLLVCLVVILFESILDNFLGIQNGYE